jgi:hypothetical protein
LLIFPEWKVALPGGQAASQNDAWVLAKCRTGLVSIAVDGKVRESFDKTLDQWKTDASSAPPGPGAQQSGVPETATGRRIARRAPSADAP